MKNLDDLLRENAERTGGIMTELDDCKISGCATAAFGTVQLSPSSKRIPVCHVHWGMAKFKARRDGREFDGRPLYGPRSSLKK